MNEYPELNLLGHTQASTYSRLTQVTSSGLNLYDLVDGSGNKITTLNLSSSYSISSSVTIITQSIATQSLFASSASWASSSLTSTSASYSLTSSHALFSKTASYVSSSGTITLQSGNNTIQLFNTNSAQRLDLYGTFTNLSSFRRLSLYENSGNMIVDCNPQGAASSSGDLWIQHSANHSIKIATAGTQRWTFGSNGDFLPAASTYNIGQVGQGVNNAWINNVFGTASIASALVPENDYQVNNFTASGIQASNIIMKESIIFPDDGGDVLIFEANSALVVSSSNGTVVMGNGICYADFGFQTLGAAGEGFYDAHQTPGRVTVWEASNPFLSSSLVTTVELETLHGVSSSISLQSQIDSKQLRTGSTYPITSSWSNNSQTASTVAPYQIYTTITTGSHLITLDYTKGKQYVSITTGALYNFTCSNPPPTGQTADVTLYIDNSLSITTSSFAFPSDWIFIGGMPLSITSSKNAVLSIESFGNKTVAAYGFQQ